jgi:hypothetical protein
MMRAVLLFATLAIARAENYWSGRCDICHDSNRGPQCSGDQTTGASRGCGFANWGCEYQCSRSGETATYWTGGCDTCFSWNRDSQCSGSIGATGGERGCGFLNAGCEYQCRRNCPNVVCQAGYTRQGGCNGRWNNYWCQVDPSHVAIDATYQPPPREVWDALGADVPAAVASVVGDPHLALPHGGRADFRGEDGAIFNFLSAKGVSLNVVTKFADFELHDADHPHHKNVHGSFLTQAHIVARTNLGKTVHASYYAEVIGATNIAFVNGTVEDAPGPKARLPGDFKLGPKANMAVDDVSMTTDYSSLHLLTPEFQIVVTPINLRQEEWGRALERNVNGVHHRLDVQIKLRVPEDLLTVAPHGIIGQGWDGDGKAINGETDNFPESGEFTTYAMAKGALEGTASDYKMASKYATAFKFSRFDATSAAPRDLAKLVASGELNTPTLVASALPDSAGSTEYNFTAM